MAYRALYREWRPKDFSHVVGQNAVISTLRNQVISKRIAHAYLFCGSRGTGKTSTAKILAKAINCLHPLNGDPCGECENCLRMEQEETLDVIEIDAASNNGVDEIRNLRDTVKYPPQFGSYKVYIIDEVHMLSPAAFNALLKTLEEPPAHIVFILATTEPQKLPETILSRCQRFDFGRITVSGITGRLKEAAEGCGAHVSDGALMLIARAAEGGMRDALSILDMCLGYSDQVDEALVRSILGTSDASFLFEFCDALADRDAGRVFMMIDRLMRDGRDPAVFGRDVCRHVRALLLARTSADDLIRIMDITAEESADYVRQAEKFTMTRLMKILDLYMALESDMRYASTPRLALENTSVKCCLKIEETDTQALTDRIAELEKKVDELAGAVRNGTPSVPQAASAAAVSPAPKVNTPLKAGGVTERSTVSADPDVWKELLSRMQKSDITAWSFLSQGKLRGGNGSEYKWQASAKQGEQQYVSALNRPDRKKMIADCLSAITGKACTFTAVESGGEPPGEDSSDDAYLEKIYQTFGREHVQVENDIR